MPINKCSHTREESYWVYDGNGIPLARACERCEVEVLSHYRPEVLRPYSQADVDEDIDPAE